MVEISKKPLLAYFRERAEKSLERINKDIPKDFREKAKRINYEVMAVRESLIEETLAQARKKKLSSDKLLNEILLITYCSYIVMIEYRNRVWNYEYMTFSRRIGELWDPFCQLCWKYNDDKGIEMFENGNQTKVFDKLIFSFHKHK